MSSTKYDKKGSMYGDLVKPLREEIYATLNRYANAFRTPINLWVYLRKFVPRIAEESVRYAMAKDLILHCPFKDLGGGYVTPYDNKDNEVGIIIHLARGYSTGYALSFYLDAHAFLCYREYILGHPPVERGRLV